MFFTREELVQIEASSQEQLKAIAKHRDRKLDDLHARQRNIVADIDYLAQNKISLLRTAGMSAEDIQREQARLEGSLAQVHEEIRIYGESAPDMLSYYLRFSELIKNASHYFGHALDSERREITTLLFTELVLKDKALVEYEAKDGFSDILARIRVTGSADWTKLEPLCSLESPIFTSARPSRDLPHPRPHCSGLGVGASSCASLWALPCVRRPR